MKPNPDKMPLAGKITWAFIALGLLIGFIILWQAIARTLNAIYELATTVPQDSVSFINKLLDYSPNVPSQTIGLLVTIAVAGGALYAFSRWMDFAFKGPRKNREGKK